MPEPSRHPDVDVVPDLRGLSDDARLTLALHALDDVRRQLQSAQRTLAGSMAEIAALGGFDDELPDDRED
ncbi:hypothetical protein [Patulibacter minatonensis]|uniref:hypothetical protein n=1 Tax=Patulibacter minatonensis TaxID=298163 RepID=UPI000479FCFB|nr:hypothetical protein [Patulibacter minatonensis]